MSQKRASRAGIQPTKPICHLESTDRKMDGTIADLKPRLPPKPSRPGNQHAQRQHEQGPPSSSYRDPVHHSALEMQQWNQASRTFAPRPLWESSWCLSGSLVSCRNKPQNLWETEVRSLKMNPDRSQFEMYLPGGFPPDIFVPCVGRPLSHRRSQPGRIVRACAGRPLEEAQWLQPLRAQYFSLSPWRIP